MIGPCLPEVVSIPHPPATFVLSLTPVVPEASECRCSHSVSKKERFGHSDCCPCLRGLGDHWLGISFHALLKATCPFLLVTPSATPDQHIYFSRSSSDDVSYWDRKMRSQRRSSNGKVSGSPPEPHSPFYRVEIIFPFYMQMENQFRKMRFVFFRWKSRTGCSAPLWGVTTGRHFHQPLCTWDVCPAAICIQRLLTHLEMGQQISEQLQEPTQGLNAPVLDTWDLGKTVLPRSRKIRFAELYFIKTERIGTCHTENTNLKYELPAAVYLPPK